MRKLVKWHATQHAAGREVAVLKDLSHAKAEDLFRNTLIRPHRLANPTPVSGLEVHAPGTTTLVYGSISQDSRLLYTRNFDGAAFDGLSFYADYPKLDQNPRQLAHFFLENGNVSSNEIKDHFLVQHGLYSLNTRPRSKSEISWANADLDVQDVRTTKLLWSRYFHSQIHAVSFDSTAETALFR